MHAIERHDVAVALTNRIALPGVGRRDRVRRVAVRPAQRAGGRVEREEEPVVVDDRQVVAEARAIAVDGDAPQDVVAIERRVLRLLRPVQVVPVERPHERRQLRLQVARLLRDPRAVDGDSRNTPREP